MTVMVWDVEVPDAVAEKTQKSLLPALILIESPDVVQVPVVPLGSTPVRAGDKVQAAPEMGLAVFEPDGACQSCAVMVTVVPTRLRAEVVEANAVIEVSAPLRGTGIAMLPLRLERSMVPLLSETFVIWPKPSAGNRETVPEAPPATVVIVIGELDPASRMLAAAEAPGAPVAPTGPVGPVAPATPTPVAPAGPVAPTAPAAPVAPVAPFREWSSKVVFWSVAA